MIVLCQEINDVQLLQETYGERDGERDGHKYINNSVMIRQSGSCGVTIQKERGTSLYPFQLKAVLGKKYNMI